MADKEKKAKKPKKEAKKFPAKKMRSLGCLPPARRK